MPHIQYRKMAATPFSILVTGANRGIGLELVKQLSRRVPKPEHIFGTTRSLGGEKSEALEALAKNDSSIKASLI